MAKVDGRDLEAMPYFIAGTNIQAFGVGQNVQPPTVTDYPLQEAVWRFAEDHHMGRRYFDLHWRTFITSGGDHLRLTIEEARELYEDLQPALEAELIDNLSCGKLVAYWQPPGAVDLSAIPKTFWPRASLNLRHGSATSHQTTVPGLIVRRPDPVSTENAAPNLQTDAPQRSGPRTGHHQSMRAALADLLRQRSSPFVSKKAAHSATLTALKVAHTTRGYGYDTFCRKCSDLLGTAQS